MDTSDIINYRLYNQRIIETKLDKPEEVVSAMGAIQAQDYHGALWAIGLRMQHATAEIIEQAIADRKIIRTWPMRGTLHFVPPENVEWMLRLLTPRILKNSGWRHKQLELDDSAFAQSRKLIIKALQGGNILPRNSLFKLLEEAHISTAGQRGIHILWKLAQEGLICFGKREGKEHTFVLLDEWISEGKKPDHDEALAELGIRYFASHGPATLNDFIWWSGLTTAQAKTSLELIKSDLEYEVVNDQKFWYHQNMLKKVKSLTSAHLLPAFDEFLVGYKDRSAAFKDLFSKKIKTDIGLLSPTILINGQVVGTWKRTFKKNKVFIETKLIKQHTLKGNNAVNTAIKRYSNFVIRVLESNEDATQNH